MSQPLLQLVTSHPATNKRLFPRRAPPWAQDISNLRPAQLKACHALGRYAIDQLRGQVEGTVEYQGRQISRGAMMVARDFPTGQGTFGGMTEQERKEERWSAADASMNSLEAVAERKNVNLGSGSVTSRGGQPQGPFATDGGEDQSESNGQDAPRQG